MRVLQLILDLELAGAQEVVRTLAEYLPEQGVEVVVCSFADGPMRQRLEALNVPVELIDRPKASIVNPPVFWAEIRRIQAELRELVERHQIDLIQTHILEMLDFVALAVRDTSRLKAVVWTIHNVEILPTEPGRLLPAKRWVYRQLYRRWASRVDGWIAVSGQVEQAIVEELGAKAMTDAKLLAIDNGVDTRRFTQAGDKAKLCAEIDRPVDAPLLLTVGRLTEQKGHRYLLGALPTVLRQHPDTQLLLVGTGELADDLRTQAETLNCAEQVHFLGRRADIPFLLASCDIFVLPSLWEGLSIALLEAMAAGQAIVATEVSGTGRALVAEASGLIVPPADSPALAEAINRFLADSALRQRLGSAARQRAISQFSAEAQAGKHVAFYRALMQ